MRIPGGKGWTLSIPPQPALCHSVGYLLHDTEQYKVIVPHVIQETEAIMGQGCGEMTIPTCAIQRMVELSVPPPSA